MALDLTALYDDAFLVADATRANPALADARERFAAGPEGKSFSYEALVPDPPTRVWFEATLLRRLVYHCESTRSPLPRCQGIFVSFFAGERLYCVPAERVIAFACELLGQTPEALVERYGTGEVRHPIRQPVALLPPGTE